MTPSALKAAGWTYDRACLTPIQQPRRAYHCWTRGEWRIATCAVRYRHDRSVHVCLTDWRTTVTITGYGTRTAALDNIGRVSLPWDARRTIGEWALTPETSENAT